MAPEVSGEDITEGESGCESEAAVHGGPPRGKPGAREGGGGAPERRRGRPAASPAAPGRRSGGEGEEQLRLLWALLEAQENLVHEDGLIREAAAAHSEVAAGNDALQRQILDAEAELCERGLGRVATPRRRRRQGRREADERSGSSVEGLAAGGRNSDDEDVELEELRMQNEALQQGLQRAARERAHRALAPATGTGCGGAGEVEALELELLRLRRAEERRAEEHHGRAEDLRDRAREAEARGREACAALREGLAEAFVEVEVLDAELQGATRGRALHLQRLRSQEQALEREVRAAAEELRALEDACGEARAAWAAECCSLGDPLGDDRLSQASTTLSSSSTARSLDSLATCTGGLNVSIWEELQHTDRNEGESSDQSAWGSLALHGEIQGDSDPHLLMQTAARHRRHRRPPASLLAYRCTSFMRRRGPDDTAAGMDAPELEGKTVQFWGPAESLDVIGEAAGVEERASIREENPPMRFPWERVKAKTAAQRMLACGGGSAGGVRADDKGSGPLPEALGAMRRPRSDSISSCSSSSSSTADSTGASTKSRMTQRLSSAPLGPHSCRGVLEWTVRELEAAPGSPRWAGPCLFEVAEEGGRRVLRALSLGLGSAEGPAKDLAIPLLSMTAVREDRQDALGLVFLVRYKTGGERVEILFRAATREARAAWVQGLCDVVQESRRSSTASTAPPPTGDG